MKKFLIVLILLVLFGLPLLAEVFVVSVPPLPDKSSIEIYEEEELFSLTVLQYYYTAAGIETLIKIHGITPKCIVPIPTLEDLEDADFKTIRKYYSICMELKNQYDENQLNYRDVEIESLLHQVRDCQKYNLQLQSENRKLILVNDKLDFYRENNAKLIDDLSNRQFVIDSLTWALYRAKDDSFRDFRANMKKNRRNMYPVFSLLGGVEKNYMYNDKLIENNGFNGQLVFNPGPIINIGRYFDVRGGVNHSSISAPGQRYYVTSYEYSVDLIMPLNEIFKFNELNLEMKLGVGFFNSEIYSPNSEIEDYDWHGELVRMELDAFNFGCEFPVGLYVSYSFYHNSKSPVFYSGNQRIDVGNKWTNGFSLGLSFALWNKMY